MSEKITLSLREILVYPQKNEQVHQKARPFSALSFKASTAGAYVANGKRVNYQPGALCLIPAGLSYRRESEREDILVFHFDTDAILPPQITVLQIEDVAACRARMELALFYWQRQAAGDHYRACAILHELFADVIAPAEQAAHRADYLAEALHYMEHHLADPTLSIEQLARRAFVSPANFRRRFAARYGMAPKPYLNQLRIQHAKHLLETGYYSVAEIATHCGFSDAGYFCTAFRRHTGTGVAAYRKGISDKA